MHLSLTALRTTAEAGRHSRIGQAQDSRANHGRDVVEAAAAGTGQLCHLRLTQLSHRKSGALVLQPHRMQQRSRQSASAAQAAI